MAHGSRHRPAVAPVSLDRRRLAGPYMHGQRLVYAGASMGRVLICVAAGLVIGLGARRLALRGRPRVLEVEHPIQQRGSQQ